MSLRVLSVAVAAGAVLAAASVSEVASQGKPLDYEAFKSKHRADLPGEPRRARAVLRLSLGEQQRLPPGAASRRRKFWTDEQSRKNFQSVSGLVVPNDPAASRLLIHPLAPEAGGDLFHSGGRQFENKNDPDWKLLAQWAGAEK